MPTHEKIAKQRMKVGLTMAEFASHLRKINPKLFKGFNISTISRIESGKRNVKTTELVGLAQVLKCRVADLVDEVGE